MLHSQLVKLGQLQGRKEVRAKQSKWIISEELTASKRSRSEVHKHQIVSEPTDSMHFYTSEHTGTSVLVDRSGLLKFHLWRAGHRKSRVAARKVWAGEDQDGCQSLGGAYLHLDVPKHTALEEQRPGRRRRDGVMMNML